MSAMPCATLEFSRAVENANAKAIVTYTVQSMLSRACAHSQSGITRRDILSYRPASVPPVGGRTVPYAALPSTAQLGAGCHGAGAQHRAGCMQAFSVMRSCGATRTWSSVAARLPSAGG